MAATVTDIPVVDFSAMSLDNKDPLSENDQAIRIVANEVYRAFSTTGFVYLKNHGISKETVSTEQNSKLIRTLGPFIENTRLFWQCCVNKCVVHLFWRVKPPIPA